jgi:hypothetical protein
MKLMAVSILVFIGFSFVAAPRVSAQSGPELAIADVRSRCALDASLTPSELRECEEEWCELALESGRLELLAEFVARFRVGTSPCHDLAMNALARTDDSDHPGGFEASREPYPGG